MELELELVEDLEECVKQVDDEYAIIESILGKVDAIAAEIDNILMEILKK